MIKIGYLVSYDYDLFFTSLNLVYEHVDRIFLCIDKDRKTWSGNSFEISDLFFKKVKQFDYKNKIETYEDSFYVPELRPLECETRQRNMLLKKMGKGWKIQIDVDEYIYDFGQVADYLKKYWFFSMFPNVFPIVLRGQLVTVFKKTAKGFLYIENGERFSFITNQYHYTRTRSNSKLKSFYTNIIAIHQSWARDDSEIQLKINNWGYSKAFDTDKYFQFWRQIEENNYHSVENFHPLSPQRWKKLKFLNSDSIVNFIDEYAKSNPQKIKPINLKVLIKSLLRITG